jgi:hypothetical protein
MPIPVSKNKLKGVLQMKTKAALFAATFLLSTAAALAANPFSDVPSDSWAYQSVSQLAQAGIINGYPDGTFKGQNDITRYEMAQMVAKAMAHSDKATVEQRAMISKLTDEFSDELDSLGVRVTNLENKVGNVKITGDTRLRYQKQDNGLSSDKNANADSLFDMRARIQFNAKLDDDTIGVVRLTSNDQEFGHFSGGSNDANDLSLDLLYIQHQFGSKVSVITGRFNQTIGTTGYWYDDHVDGAAVTLGTDKIKLNAGYARFLEMSGFSNYTAYDNDLTSVTYDDPKVGYGQLSGQIGKNVTLMAMYMKPTLSFYNGYARQSLDKIYGLGSSINLGSKVNLSADYLKTSFKSSDDATFWAAKLQYGIAQTDKVGTWDLFVDYVNADNNSYLGGTNSLRPSSLLNNAKSWGIGADYVLAKGLTLTAFQTVNSSIKDSENGYFTDPEEYTRVQVTYAF